MRAISPQRDVPHVAAADVAKFVHEHDHPPLLGLAGAQGLAACGVGLVASVRAQVVVLLLSVGDARGEKHQGQGDRDHGDQRGEPVELAEPVEEAAIGGIRDLDPRPVALPARPWRELFLEASGEEHGSGRVFGGSLISHNERSARVALGYGAAVAEARYHAATRSSLS